MNDQHTMTLNTTPITHPPSHILIAIHIRLIQSHMSKVLILCMTIPVPANITKMIHAPILSGTLTNHNCAICPEYLNFSQISHAAISGPKTIPKHAARPAKEST